VVEEVGGCVTVTDPSVNPKHYKCHPSGIEAIQITEWFNNNVGQVFQYLWRSGLKESAPILSDIRKAVWFCNRELMRLGGESMLKEGIEGPPVLSSSKSSSEELVEQGKIGQETILKAARRMRRTSDV
jgi:hypothetical protein